MTLAEMNLIGARCIEKRAFHALVMFLLATINVNAQIGKLIDTVLRVALLARLNCCTNSYLPRVEIHAVGNRKTAMARVTFLILTLQAATRSVAARSIPKIIKSMWRSS